MIIFEFAKFQRRKSSRNLFLIFLQIVPLFTTGFAFGIDANPSFNGFSKEKLVKVTILVEHDGWRIQNIPILSKDYKGKPGEWYTGASQKSGYIYAQCKGSYTIEGMMGWKARLLIDEAGEVSISSTDTGPCLSNPVTIKKLGQVYFIFMPAIHKVRFNIPWSFYRWAVLSTPEFYRNYWRTGHWNMQLPEGRWTIQGQTGWKIEFRLNGQGIQIVNYNSGPYLLPSPGVTTKDFLLNVVHPLVLGMGFHVPSSLEQWEVSSFVGKKGDGFAYFPAGIYELKGPRIGSIVFRIDKDHAEIVQTELVNKKLSAKIQGYELFIEDNRTSVRENLLFPRRDALYLFSKDNRIYFRQGEYAEFSVVLSLAQEFKGGVINIEERMESAYYGIFQKELISLSRGRHVFNFRLNTRLFKPGSYELHAKVKDVEASIYLNILEKEPSSHFRRLIYGPYQKSADLQRFAEGGVNLLIHNQLGPGTLTARMKDMSLKEKYERKQWDLDLPPVEIDLRKTRFRYYAEDLLSQNIDLMAQHSSTHQFFHSNTCFLDPVIYQRVCRNSLCMIQAIKEYPNIVAFNLGDESGVHRGIEYPEGCSYCRGIFEKHFEIKVPDSPENGDANWLKWMDFKQEMLPFLMHYVKIRIKKISSLLVSAQNGGANFWPQDGGYPPRAMREFEVSAGHHYYAWAYGSVQTLWTALHDELVEIMPRKIIYWPFILAHTGLSGTLHEIYLSLARKCEGVGYFTDPEKAYPGQWDVLSKKLLRELVKFGDFFLSIDRVRNEEIAIFYSYQQHALDCYVDSENWVKPVRKYLDRIAAAFYACLRAHIPAGLISEEQILKGDLRGRKVLLLVSLKQINREVLWKIKEFISQGGVVYSDSETSIELEGVKKLGFSFEEFHERSYQLGRFKDTALPKNDDEATLPLAKKLKKEWASLLRLPALADSPYLVITKQAQAEGQYLFLLNDHFDGILKEKGRDTALFKPLITRIEIPHFQGFLYDVLQGRKMEPEIIGGSAVLNLCFFPAEVKILCCLPEEIHKIQLFPEQREDLLKLDVQILDKFGKNIQASFPLEIKVYDADNKERFHLYRAAANGSLLLDLPIAINESFGNWHVVVKELISGVLQDSEFKVFGESGKDQKPNIVQELPDVIVYDNATLNEFLKNKKRISIAIGSFENKALAEKIAQTLYKYGGIKADIVFDNELQKNKFPLFCGYGTSRSDDGFNSAAPNIEINRDLIILGSPLNNQLARSLYFDSELPTRFISPDFPGAGRGILQCIKQAFSDRDHDVILVTSLDAEGLEAAGEELIKLVQEANRSSQD